jgi:dienelactone hydrolase
MRVRSVVANTAGFMIAFIGVTELFLTTVGAQTVRIEVHPLQVMTLTDEQFLTGVKYGKPTVIAGELRIPRPGTARLLAVVLVQGSGGVGANVDRWAQELNGMGIATFTQDGFAGRGMTNTVTDQAQLGQLTMINDAYRALELLAKHPRIDQARIGLMGFSRGGRIALYASLKRFQQMHGPQGAEFAAYLPFYAPCNTTYIDDGEVSDKPIRLFHGAADDWVPVAPCRTYVERLRKAGKDVQLTEYSEAYHAFDVHTPTAPLPIPQVQTGRRCLLEETAGGQIINRQTQQAFSIEDPCIERGVTVVYNAQALGEALKAVKEFLAVTFNLNQ